MKWFAVLMLFFLGLLVLDNADAKVPRTVELEESEIYPVKVAVGFTTILQFNSKPTSVILGDQDAFKIEYIGYGIAIKPLVAKAQSNLFIFTNYDRFSFRLSVDNNQNSDYIIKVRKKSIGDQSLEEPGTAKEKLLKLKLNKSSVCDGKFLEVSSLSWPLTQSVYLIDFRVGIKNWARDDEIEIEPGDFELHQAGAVVPIETMNLSGLTFTKINPVISGVLVIKQKDLKKRYPLVFSFSSPEFLKNKNVCLKVSFSRTGGKD